MRYLFLLVGIINAGILSAQNEVLSKIPTKGKIVSDFIPAGYDTLETAKGDLNKDRAIDYVLALYSKVEDTDSGLDFTDTLPRILIILFADKAGYTLAAKTNKLVMCKSCGGVFGNPFEGIAIEKGVLCVYHYGGSAWRWSYTHKFRYQQNDFYLIGETLMTRWNIENCEKLNDAPGRYKDVNLLTGSFEEREISENCVLIKNKKGKQKVEPLRKLSEFNIDN